MEQTDFVLLDRYRRDRSQAAFAQLVRRHMGLVYHLCRRRLRDEHLAQDAAQAVFIVLARRGPSVIDPSATRSLSGWLYRTSQLACANLMRERERRSRRERLVAEERSRH